MQIVETLNEGLKRAYTLTVTAKDIDARVDAEIKTIAPQVRMPGFRPGKVPANLVRKMHGPALQREALDKSVREGVEKIVTVSDAQLVSTLRFFAERMKMVVEPTGCLAAAAVLSGVLDCKGKRIGIVLSGGNVDLAALAGYLA